MKNGFKSVLAVLCVLAMALALVNTAAFASPATLGPSDEKRVLKPGCVDEATGTGDNILSDYATTYGNVCLSIIDWAGGSKGTFWGIDGSAAAYHIWNATTSPASGIIYHVKPGTYVSVPIKVFNNGGIAGLRLKVKFAYSADKAQWTDYTADQVNGLEMDTTNPLLEIDPDNGGLHTYYATVQIPEGMNWLRVQFPSAQDFVDSGAALDWINASAFCVGYAKASSTPITAYTGAAAGDAVVNYYEDPDNSTPDDSTPDDSTPDDSTPDDSDPDDSTPDDSTPDDSTSDDSTSDDSTPDDSTSDDSTSDDSTPDDSDPDDSTPDDSDPDDSTPDDSTSDDSTPDDSDPDESTPDDSDPDESTPNDNSAISVLPRPAYDNNCGWENRLVTLEGDRLSVRVEDGATVTLQDVQDNLQLTQTTVKFYQNDEEITDLTTKVANGIVMKAIATVTNTVYDEYTMWVYNYATPSILNNQPKRVLKPGVIDSLWLSEEGVWCSDYARILGYMMYAEGTITGDSADTYLTWMFDNADPRSNIQWGQAHPNFYARAQKSGNEQEGVFTGLEYRVVAGSYVAIPVRFHAWLSTDLSKVEPSFTVSADGNTWTTLEKTEDNYNTFTLTENNGNIYYTYHVFKIPEGCSYLRVGITDTILNHIVDTVNGDWVNNGAYTIGMAKASWTPITGVSGEAAGDPVVGWYGDNVLESTDVLKVHLEDAKAYVRKVGDEVITLQNILDTLKLELCEVVFKDAQGAVITDMTTAAANGQTIHGISKGHLFNDDGVEFVSYTIEMNEITEVKTPELISKDETVVVDEDSQTITATYYIDEPMSFEDLKKALEVSYGEIKFYDANGTEITDLTAELNGEASVKLYAKDCPGVPDGMVAATYQLIVEKEVKETKFESKDEDKVKIDTAEKVITVLEGMTVEEFLANLDLQFAELEIYTAAPEEALVTDPDTKITDGMSLLLVTDAVSIPYEFKTMVAEDVSSPEESVPDESSPEESVPDESQPEEPVGNPDTGVAMPLVSLALLGFACVGVVAAKKRHQ